MCSRTIAGKTSTFGTTGYTRDNVFVLYDRVTDSLWHPLQDGRLDAVAGARQGEKISFLLKPDPVALKEWVAEHPKTKILLPPPEEFAGPRGFLGVRLAGAEPLIEEVIQDTAAARAGLKAGDRILRLDATEITRRRAVTELLGSKRPGDPVTLLIQRGDVHGSGDPPHHG